MVTHKPQPNRYQKNSNTFEKLKYFFDNDISRNETLPYRYFANSLTTINRVDGMISKSE